jgi:hypothetical protein
MLFSYYICYDFVEESYLDVGRYAQDVGGYAQDVSTLISILVSM